MLNRDIVQTKVVEIGMRSSDPDQPTNRIIQKYRISSDDGKPGELQFTDEPNKPFWRQQIEIG